MSRFYQKKLCKFLVDSHTLGSSYQFILFSKFGIIREVFNQEVRWVLLQRFPEQVFYLALTATVCNLEVMCVTHGNSVCHVVYNSEISTALGSFLWKFIKGLTDQIKNWFFKPLRYSFLPGYLFKPQLIFLNMYLSRNQFSWAKSYLRFWSKLVW